VLEIEEARSPEGFQGFALLADMGWYDFQPQGFDYVKEGNQRVLKENSMLQLATQFVLECVRICCFLLRTSTKAFEVHVVSGS